MSSSFDAFYRSKLKELGLYESPVGIHTYIKYQPRPIFGYYVRERRVAQVLEKPDDTPDGLTGKFRVMPERNRQVWDLIKAIEDHFGSRLISVIILKDADKIGARPG